MKHHAVVTVALTLLLVSFSWAGGQARCDTNPLDSVQVKAILVKWKQPVPSYVKIRVKVHNTGQWEIRENFQVRLYLRGSETEGWRPIKTWQETAIGAGQEMSLDYQPVHIMDPVLYLGKFETKAEILQNKRVIHAYSRNYPNPKIDDAEPLE